MHAGCFYKIFYVLKKRFLNYKIINLFSCFRPYFRIYFSMTSRSLKKKRPLDELGSIEKFTNFGGRPSSKRYNNLSKIVSKKLSFLRIIIISINGHYAVVHCHPVPCAAIQCHPKQRYERVSKAFFVFWRTQEPSISAGCCRTSDGHDMKKGLLSDSIVLIFQKHVFFFPFAK